MGKKYKKKTQQEQLNKIVVKRNYCSCGDKWSANTNRQPPEDLSVICENCDSYIMINQY